MATPYEPSDAEKRAHMIAQFSGAAPIGSPVPRPNAAIRRLQAVGFWILMTVLIIIGVSIHHAIFVSAFAFALAFSSGRTAWRLWSNV